MKKNLMWMLVLSVWTMLYACSDSDKEPSEVPLTVAPNKVEFSAEGGTQELAVITAAEAWTASSDAEWCKVVQDGAKLTVTAEAHNDVELRTAKVTVKAERAVDQIVEVRQSGAASATLELAVGGEVVDELELEFLAKTEESQTIAITTNQAIVAVDTVETALWCKVTLADDNASLSVVCDVNSEPERETTFKVVAGTESNKAEKTVKVKQADGSFKIELSDKEVELNAMGYRVMVTANVEVKAASNASWCQAQGFMNNIIISASTNFSASDREAVVTVSVDGEDETIELKVTQTGEAMNKGDIFNYRGKPVGLILKHENKQITIMALEEKEGLQWSTKTDYLGLDQAYQHEAVFNKVKEQENWKENYPLFAYCADMDENTGMSGWYIPEAPLSYQEMQGVGWAIIGKVGGWSAVNSLLTAKGYDEIDTKSRYWTCSEKSGYEEGSCYFFYILYGSNNFEWCPKTNTKTPNGTILKARCFWSGTYQN